MPAAGMRSAGKSGTEIRDDVISELRRDPQIAGPGAIGVAAGAVTPTDHSSYAEKLAAAAAAPGAVAVESHLVVSP